MLLTSSFPGRGLMKGLPMPLCFRRHIYGSLLVAFLMTTPLQAAPWCIVDESGKPVPAAVLTEALDGPFRDARKQFEALDILSPLALGALDALPPEGAFDESFRKRWMAETEACKAKTAPPYGRRNRLASLCGATAAETLWQAWLEREGCVGLLRFSRGAVSEFRWYRTDSDALHEINLNTSKDDLAFVAAIKTALSSSATGHRNVWRPAAVPAAPPRQAASSAAQAAVPAEVVAAIPPPTTCGTLPTLTLTGGAGALAAATIDLWNRSTPTRTGTLSCRLEVLEQPAPAHLTEELLEGVKLTFLLVEIDCGSFRVKADHRSFAGGGVTEPRSQAAIAKKIVRELQKSLCR